MQKLKLFFKRRVLFCVLLLGTNAVYAQSFYSAYKNYQITNNKHINSKLLDQSLRMMQQAFAQYETTTKKSIFVKDTLFIVSSASIETGETTIIAWNRSYSMLYTYNYKGMILFKPDASEWINEYKPEFKTWVETADTASYNKFGRQSSWFDAPSVSFTTAIRVNDYWNFTQSGSYTNNLGRLN